MPTQNINVGGRGINPTITLIGDWDKAKNLINNLGPAVTIGAHQGQVAAAKKIVALVKDNIRRGGPAGTYWPSYSMGYQKNKMKAGANSDKKWRYTDTYLNAITVIDKVTSVHAGVPRGARGKVNDPSITLGQIAVILERGSAASNIAARPLWKPTFRQFGGKARVQYHITWHIRKNIALATGLRSKIKF